MVIPEPAIACALCHDDTNPANFCWGCGLYVCDPCDLHIPTVTDDTYGREVI